MDLFDGSAHKYKNDYPNVLIHFSAEPDIKILDPDYIGTSDVVGKDTANGVPRVHRLYFYRQGTKPEDIVTSNSMYKYIVAMPDESLLKDIANEEYKPSSDALLSKIKSQGYLGFYNSKSSLPNVVALFYKTPVISEIKAPEDEVGYKNWLNTEIWSTNNE